MASQALKKYPTGSQAGSRTHGDPGLFQERAGGRAAASNLGCAPRAPETRARSSPLKNGAPKEGGPCRLGSEARGQEETEKGPGGRGTQPAPRDLPFHVPPGAEDTVGTVHPQAQLTRTSTAQPEAAPCPASLRLAGGLLTNHQQSRR